MDNLRRHVMLWLIGICTLHSLLVVVLCVAIFRINLPESGDFSLVASSRALWLNSSLIGLIGSLLFFSRKAYVYLITDKLYRISEANGMPTRAADHASPRIDLDIYRTRLAGYYLYLIARPIGGLVIGPFVTMILLGGLTTLSASASIEAKSPSVAGMYLIYVLSFAGGYTSSDMFDYVSKQGARLLAKSKWQ
jgi:hypothetical protein